MRVAAPQRSESAGVLLLAAPRLAQVGRAAPLRDAGALREARAALLQFVRRAAVGEKYFPLEAVWGCRRGWVSLTLGVRTVEG